MRSGDQISSADAVVLATDFKQTRKFLELLPGEAPSLEIYDRLIAAPITTIHLWYDRRVTDLDHAVLLDTRIQ